MKTALFTGSYLEGRDPLGSDRYERIARFITWHRRLLPGADLFLSDNASAEDLAIRLKWQNPDITLLRHVDSLVHGPGGNDYPYCWRMLYDAKTLIQLGYERIIFLDSDCFLLSNRVLGHIDDSRSGWESFLIPKYGFPSAEFHILCKDAFPVFEQFTSVPYQAHVGKLMETELPFTRINKMCRIDRWGETRHPQEHWMDCYSQAPVDLPLEFVS